MNSVVSNKPFEDKILEYTKSPFYLTKSIGKIDEVGVHSAINHISNQLASFNKWDKTSIEKRQEILYKLSLDIWAI